MQATDRAQPAMAALKSVRTLPATATLPHVAALPATATLATVIPLAATATLEIVALDPATAALRREAALPATATLSWVASSDSSVTGYRIYYGNASRTYNQPMGSGVNAGKVTTFTVSNLQRGPVYYFSVTAVDASGNESAYSNEVMKMIQ